MNFGKFWNGQRNPRIQPYLDFENSIHSGFNSNMKILGIHPIHDWIWSHECPLRITLIDNTGRFYEISNISKDFWLKIASKLFQIDLKLTQCKHGAWISSRLSGFDYYDRDFSQNTARKMPSSRFVPLFWIFCLIRRSSIDILWWMIDRPD